jgi:hypothetical protein
MNEVVKICKIHGPLVKDQVRKDNRCKLCRSITNKKTYDKDPQKRVDYAKKWKQKNRLHVNEWAREDRKNNPEKYKEWSKAGREKAGTLRSIKDVTRIRGITLEHYYQMIGGQDNRCSICNERETRLNRMGNVARLCIDHNHSTNKVRALLCHNCNQVIGHCKESIEILQKAIEYLKKHSE